ncbi:13453_t:CDS:2 [Rhizophagus irregularis]|nr:13453_t:CDS:2 [Rhizophagus irregularis]
MTSSNYVKIDWSSYSHSFIQLGEPSPSVDDYQYHPPEDDMSNVLTTKDIFALDIDDYFPKSEHVPTDFVNNKASYANLLYYRWLDDKLKRITSRQLGISYNSNIHARDSLLSRNWAIDICIKKLCPTSNTP